MRARDLPLILAAAVALAPAGLACDPHHDWRPAGETTDRRADPTLVRDMLRAALGDAGAQVDKLAILSLEDEYAAGDPEQTMRDLSRQVEAKFREVGMVLVSGEAVRALVDSAGPDAAFLPGVVEDVATRTGATVLARVALLRYSGSTVRLADHYEVNAGLYKDQVTHQLTARVALCDPSGAVRWIDEIHAIQSRTEMYWGDEAPGGRKVLQTRWVPYVGETEEWEDPSLHAGESTAEAIERGVRKASEAERDRARIRNEVLRSAGVLPPEL